MTTGRHVYSPSSRLKRLVDVRSEEIPALLWAFIYFFSLLCSYYILRPVRDEMGIAGGVENLQWLFTGTFIAMLAVVPLFGWITTRFPRRQFLPYTYYFFVINLMIFFVLFKSNITHAYIARSFYIWVSVFNLFVVSVFWSFMTDIFNNDQSKRLFGIIAAGGTAGALVGPLLTGMLVGMLGPTNLLLISAILLGLAVYSINRIGNWQTKQASVMRNQLPSEQRMYGYQHQHGLRGGIFTGIRLVFSSPYLLGICLLILLYTTLATFLYFQQAQIIRDSFSDPSARTAVFAGMDFAVNALTIVFQILLTGRLVKSIGIAWTLALVPLCLACGFLFISYMPVLTVLVIVQVVRRAGNYAIMRPAREMLYVVLTKEEKYKAKNFIDTVVYRGGDAVSAWIYTGFKGLGLNLASIALIAVPLAGIWAWVAFKLGAKREQFALGKPV